MDIEEFKIKALPVKNKLFRIAKRLLNNHEEAEDAVQEAFIKLWLKRDELEKYKSIEAFAVTITKNLCIDILRSKKAVLTEMNEEFQKSQYDTPEQSYEKNEVYRQIKQAIEQLPENQKIAIQLRDIEGYEMEEVAKILDTSVGNVRVILSRARNAVKDSLIRIDSHSYEKN